MKATKWKLTWLPEIVDLVPLQLWDFGPLITKKKPEEDDDIADLVSSQSVRCNGHMCCWLLVHESVDTACKTWLIQQAALGCAAQDSGRLGPVPTHGHTSASLRVVTNLVDPHLVRVRLPGNMRAGRPNCSSRPPW